MVNRVCFLPLCCFRGLSCTILSCLRGMRKVFRALCWWLRILNDRRLCRTWGLLLKKIFYHILLMQWCYMLTFFAWVSILMVFCSSTQTNQWSALQPATAPSSCTMAHRKKRRMSLKLGWWGRFLRRPQGAWLAKADVFITTAVTSKRKDVASIAWYFPVPLLFFLWVQPKIVATIDALTGFPGQYLDHHINLMAWPHYAPFYSVVLTWSTAFHVSSVHTFAQRHWNTSSQAGG